MGDRLKQKFVARFARIPLVVMLALTASGPAVMAESGGVTGLLNFFFGGAKDARPQAAPAPLQSPATAAAHKPRKRVRDFVPAATTRAPGTPGGAPVAASFFIDVLGDSLGVLAADGLTQAYAGKPEVAVASKAQESSGLVRVDYYDWQKSAHDLASSKDHIDFVVIMLGINDLQAMKDGANSLDTLSDPWRVAYGQRIEAMVEPFRVAHIPVAWVGLPPMRAELFNADVIKLNELYKERSQHAGAKYIDIWDAFADQSGQYNAYGPDVDGQNAKLRGVDGIHFTKAGSRKVAQFLEAEIKHAMDKGRPQEESATLPPDIEQAAVEINAQIRLEMGVKPTPGVVAPLNPEKPLSGPILSLTARPVAAGGVLATRATLTKADLDPAVRMLHQGDALEPRPGRADDFAWPRL
jgi:hypothetical protein